MFRFLLILALIITTCGARAATCPAGEYLNNGACVTCLESSYCPGDDKVYLCHDLWSNNIPGISAQIGYTTSYDPTTPDGCICRFRVQAPNNQTATYETWSGKCNTGPTDFVGIGRNHCRTGYYASEHVASDLYDECTPCTNAPENTEYITSGTADANDCQWRCNDGYIINSNGTGCETLCTLGFRHLNTTTNVSIPLYSEKRTTPSINIGHDAAACYADLAVGRATGAINVLWQDTIYHTISPTTILQCDAGYYLDDDGGCAPCYETHFCPGDNTRVSCTAAIIDEPAYPIPTIYAEPNPKKYTRPEQCRCMWDDNLSDERRVRYYIIGYCYRGAAKSLNYVYYYNCRTGYYAIGSHGVGSRYYQDCAPCTNGPENSYYTSYSTPSVQGAVESNCPWECNDGWVRDGDACVPQ